MKCWQCSKTATHEFKYAEDEAWRPFCGSRDCGPVSMWSLPYGTAIRPATPPMVPRHSVPAFYDDHGIARYVCECGTVDGLHEFGRHRQCEYFNHHCEPCHERGLCTAHQDE